MENIQEYLEQIVTLCDLELSAISLIQGDALNKITSRFGIRWDVHPMYLSDSNIVFTNNLEHDRLCGVDRGLNTILIVSLKEFDLHLYVCRRTESKVLNKILEAQ